MELSFNTENRQAGVGLRALQQYSSKQYKEAIASFTDILDLEPNNWDARLLLAACYYKTSQYITAQRIFTFISNNCQNVEILSRARQALRATQFKMEHGSNDLPPEFGCYNNPGMKQIVSANWLDECA